MPPPLSPLPVDPEPTAVSVLLGSEEDEDEGEVGRLIVAVFADS